MGKEQNVFGIPVKVNDLLEPGEAFLVDASILSDEIVKEIEEVFSIPSGDIGTIDEEGNFKSIE
ncbi:hypothetical protein [Cognatishimia sp.]|uniref:hypothetical protein n=1 Tax=Cognatishimia sp. TaxID=2211648 RepID=UPI00351897F1|nr:hypothetical protein [Cognatishimia sp.]